MEVTLAVPTCGLSGAVHASARFLAGTWGVAMVSDKEGWGFLEVTGLAQ